MFDALHAELDGLRDVPLPDVATCGAEAVELLRLCARTQAQALRRLAVVDRAGIAVEQGLSTGSWLAHEARMDRGPAGSLVRACRAPMPAMTEVFGSGEVSLAHAQVAGRVIADLPEEVQAKADAVLAQEAVNLTPNQLRTVGEHLKQIFAPENLPKDDEKRYAARKFSAGVGFDGMVNVSGRLEPEVGAALLAGLSSASRPDADGEVRTAAQRRADAFAIVLEHALPAGSLPESGGERPQVVVTIDLDRLRQQQDAAPATGNGVRDHRIDPAGLPAVNWTGPISPDVARRIACDAGVTRVLTRGGSEAIAVGRKTRVIPRALRLAVTLRDKTCRWPGCTMPPDWAEVHHVCHWSDGGATDACNCLLLCKPHHRAAHSGTWTVILTAPGRIDVRRRRTRHDPCYEIRLHAPPDPRETPGEP